MKTIYLGGPIAGCTREDMHDWREVLKWQGAYSFLFRDPTDRVYPETKVDHFLIKKIVTEDKVDIAASDILVQNISQLNKYRCVGTIQEIMYGWDMGKYVIVIVDPDDNVSPWVTYHCHKIVHSVEEAYEAMKEVR
jgi:hypothetical protein